MLFGTRHVFSCSTGSKREIAEAETTQTDLSSRKHHFTFHTFSEVTRVCTALECEGCELHISGWERLPYIVISPTLFQLTFSHFPKLKHTIKIVVITKHAWRTGFYDLSKNNGIRHKLSFLISDSEDVYQPLHLSDWFQKVHSKFNTKWCMLVELLNVVFDVRSLAASVRPFHADQWSPWCLRDQTWGPARQRLAWALLA